jgi:hypothetical protein
VDYPRTFTAAAVSLLAAVVLFWLMDVNFLGWLGAWLAADAGAWLVGTLIAFGLCAGFAAIWTASLATRPGVRKLPTPVGGVLFGLVVGLLFATLVPILLSAIAGDPGMVEGGGSVFDGFPAAFGGRVVPALPDLGFRPPLHGLADTDWVSRDDHVGRLLPFSLAFMLFGALLQLGGKRGE